MHTTLDLSSTDKCGMTQWLFPTILHTLVLLAGLNILFWPMIFSGCTRLQDNPVDTLLNHYILEHTWVCISKPGYVGDFWNPPFFYPATNVLAYSETLVGVAPIYWLFRVFFSELFAYQLWIMTMASGTYIGTVWALRRMQISHLAAATAAFLFSFGMIRSNQVGHQQLLCQLFTAPAIAFLWSYLQQGKSRDFLGMTACATLQILTCIYLGWFTAMAMVLFSIMAMVFERHVRGTVLAHLRNNWVTVSIIAGAASACILPILATYYLANNESRRPLSECILYAPRWSSWLAPPPGWIARPFMSQFTHKQHCMETWLFFGFMPYMLAMCSLVAIIFKPSCLPASTRLLIICALASFATLVAISLVWNEHSFWTIVYFLVPGAKAIRVVARIWTVAFLFLVIAGAAGWDHGIQRWLAAPRWRQTAGLAVLTIAMVEQVRVVLPSFLAEPFYREANRLAERIQGADMAYIRPSTSPAILHETSHLCAMWAGLKANVRVINGYSGRNPAHYPSPEKPWSAPELATWLRDRESPKNVRIIDLDSSW